MDVPSIACLNVKVVGCVGFSMVVELSPCIGLCESGVVGLDELDPVFFVVLVGCPVSVGMPL